MKDRIFFWITCLVFVISFSCGQKHEKVEINVSNSIKEAIEDAAPAKEYCFYALKESFPKNIEEMNKAKFFVCGEVEIQADLKVMMASLDDLSSPLFKSIHLYLINPNILSGQLAMSEDVSITLKNGEIMKIPRKKSICGRETSIDTLVRKCSEEMKKNSKSVLLIGKSIDSKVLDQMVEIIFK